MSVLNDSEGFGLAFLDDGTRDDDDDDDGMELDLATLEDMFSSRDEFAFWAVIPASVLPVVAGPIFDDKLSAPNVLS